jgi:hypothetical protein
MTNYRGKIFWQLVKINGLLQIVSRNDTLLLPFSIKVLMIFCPSLEHPFSVQLLSFFVCPSKSLLEALPT